MANFVSHVLAFGMKSEHSTIDTLWIFEKEVSRLNDTTPQYEGVIVEYLHKIKVHHFTLFLSFLLFGNCLLSDPFSEREITSSTDFKSRVASRLRHLSH